ncbi:MAG: hypothetical protein ACLU8J_10015 [Acutalibacter sp.]
MEELKRGRVELQNHDSVYFVKAPWLLKIMNAVNFDDSEPSSISSGCYRNRRDRRAAGNRLPEGIPWTCTI